MPNQTSLLRNRLAVTVLIAILGALAGSSTMGQSQPGGGTSDPNDQIHHDRFEGPPNQPPVIALIPNQTVPAGTLFEYLVEASDPYPPWDVIRYALEQAPGGMSIDKMAGLISWQPALEQQGVHPVQVRVSDQYGGVALESFSITVTPPDFVNEPPTLAAISDRSLLVGQVLSIQPVASDPNLPNDLLSFSLSGAPAGLSLASATGGITWAPLGTQVGQWPLTLTVTDAGGLSDSASFTVTVKTPGAPPSLAAIPDQSLLVGELLDLTAQASDPDLPDDELSFSLVTAPPGMSINAISGQINWTPGANRVGRHDVTVQVRDQVGLLGFTDFVVEVRAPNRAPVALNDEYRAPRGETTTIDAPGVMENDFDPDGDPIVAELVSGPSRGVLDFRTDGSFDYTPGTDRSFAAELYTDFRTIEIDGVERFFNLRGEAVAADMTGDGRSELVVIGRRSGVGDSEVLTVLAMTEGGELESLWHWDGRRANLDTSLDPLMDFAMRNSGDVVLGDLTGDGVPEIVVTGYCRGDILIFSASGERLVSTQAGRVPIDTETSPECPAFYGSGSVGDFGRLAMVDLIGDGSPEILLSTRNQLRAFDGQGVLLWEAVAPDYIPGGDDQYDFAVADVNLDGRPNIWFGGALFDADGVLLWSRPSTSSWRGMTAVANLNDDPNAELIHLGDGHHLVVLDHEGNCLWQARRQGNLTSTLGCPPPTTIPGTNAPFYRGLMVGDIVGDGVSRIVIGSRGLSDGPQINRVAAFNPDGSLFWSVPTALSTGGDVRVNQINGFDFTGNGVMELVVTGVNGTIVLDGRDGSTVFEIPSDASNPGIPGGAAQDMLYSIIVDLDGDGATELVVTSKGPWLAGSLNPATGVFVYRDPQNRWMPNRQVWNQRAYSITNVNPDGSIPSPAQPNWRSPGLNNYRVNALPVAERTGAVLVDSFREMVIEGVVRTWRVNRGTVVAADLTGNGRSELVAIGQRASGIGNTQYLTALSFNEDNELEPLWFWNGWLSAVPDRDFAMRNARDPVIGDIDGDGIPEVIVSAYCRGDILVFSNLGEPLISTQAGRVPQPGQGESTPDCPFTGSGNVADAGRISLVDLTGNGLPEILYGFKNIMRAFDNQGTLLWETSIPNFSPGGFPYDHAVADVNLDGRPNIFFGGALLDADGNILWSKATNPLSSDWIGEYAVANLNDDPFAELIYWGNGPDLIVFDHQGNCLWQARKSPTPNPAPTLGCPGAVQIPDLPTASPGFRTGMIVADITGDGRPRIVIGNATINNDLLRNRVIAFNPDGTPLWSVPALLSSGASVGVNQINAFDLTGNGVMELVVTGVNGTVVLDGRTGATLWEIPADANNPGFGTSTGYYMLYSIIVDMDGDGAAELVVSSQGSPGLDGLTPTGLFVYRHPENRWMPARGVWNQWAYSVTNINEDLSIPSPAERNWLTRGLNNHRVNAFMPGESGALDRFTYRVSDGELSSNEATVWIDIRRPNRPPVFISSPVDRAGVGLDYRYRVHAVDPDPGDEATVRLDRGPAGMVLDAAGVLRWQPGASDLGEHLILLSAIDLEGEISLQEFTLSVVEALVVPDVIDLPEAQAIAAIEAAGFVGGQLSEVRHFEIEEGRVAEQQPLPGGLQIAGSAIDLAISTGPGPIDDSFPPEFPVEAILIDPDTLRLRSGERRQLRAFAEFADGSTQLITRAVSWSATGSAASVSSNGEVRALSGGVATISAEIDGVIGTALVSVIPTQFDDEAPIAEISSPGEGEVVFEAVEVIGTASDENLVRFELALRPAGRTGPFVLINQGTESVTDGVLGTFDPTVLLNGFYDLRLRVLDAAGNETVTEITVQADGEQKAGLFTLAFTDLTLPLGGLPIVLERVYDSRDRSMGDFGMGWRLGLRSIELTCGSPLGENWHVARSGLSFALLPTREKACAISLPGGRMEVFDIEPNVSNSPFVPFLSLNMRVQPRSGSLGQLEIIGNRNVLIVDPQPGPVSLVDDMTLQTFRPRQFRYTMPDGTVFDFQDGKVTKVTDLNGNSLSFSVGGIEHSSGIGVTFERDALGRITAITDPSGHTQTYAYSANGDLASHTDVLGNTTRFFYNSRHGLVRIEDPLGNSAIRSEYDERGRLIALIDAAGNRTEHSYDDEARLKTTIFPDGSVRTVAYDARGNIEVQGQLVTIDGQPVFVEETWEYDDFGNPTRTVDADGVVEEAEWNDEREWSRRVIDPGGLNLVEEQTFDSQGRVQSMVDAAGRVRQFQYDSRGNVAFSPGPGGTDIGVEYDSAGRIRGFVNPVNARTRTQRNPAGQVLAREILDPQGVVLSRTEFVRDANGRVTTQTEIPLAGEGPPRTTSFSYDALGRILSVTNPLGEITRFEYDANGQNTAIVDPLGQRIEMDYDARGLMLERRLPDGGIEQFEYDHAGQLTRHTDPDGVIHEMAYDELGRLVAESINGQVRSRTVYTPAGRVAARIDALGHRTDLYYDAAGRLVRQLLPEVHDTVSGQLRRPEILIEYNGTGQPVTMTDPLGRRMEYEYDSAGFQRQLIHPDGHSRQTIFDAAGRFQALLDEEGHSTLFEYDAAGRLIRVLQPAPGPGQPRPETRFVYDSFGQLRTRIDALGRVTAFEYNGAGRPIRTILPDGSSRETEYDSAGRAIRIIDFDATVLEFEFDAMGRMLSRSAPGLMESISYTAAGRRAQVSDSRGLTSFSYDGQGRMTGFVESDGLGIDYQFDANGRITSLTVAGQTTSYAWDALGRLASVTTAAGTTSYAYDLAGQLRQKTLPNGVIRQADYDLRGRPLNVALLAPDSILLESFVSTYSPRGKRLSVTTSDGSVESYVYDPIGRLVEAQRSGSDPFALSFDYDPVGNRLRQVLDGIETVYGYGPNHELLSAGGDSFSYDSRGNRTSAVVNGDAVSYQWDAFGRLVGAGSPDGMAQFDYDIDNRRVARTVNGQRTGMLIDPQSVSGLTQVVAEFDANAQVQARWDYGHKVLSQQRAGQVRHYGHDHRGSVHLLSNAAGQVTDRYAYLPFGDLLSSSGTTPNPYRFNAERWESAARSYDLRARSYDSCSGTFLSRDPFPGFQHRPFSLHPYQFGDADPINHIDPLGLATMIEISITRQIETGLKAVNIGRFGGTMCKLGTVVKVVNTARALLHVGAIGLNLGRGGFPVEIDVEEELGGGATLGIKLKQDLRKGEGEFVVSVTESRNRGRLSGGGKMGVGWKPDRVYPIGGLEGGYQLLAIGLCNVTVATLNAKLAVDAHVGLNTHLGTLGGGMSVSGSLSLDPEEKIGGAVGFGGYEVQIFEISRSSLN